jgi:hypothetical protein
MVSNALVMAGHVRTFKSIAEELTHFIRFNELDVYLYIWDEGNQDEIDFVVKTLKPIKWKAEKNEIYLPEFLEAEQRIVTKNPKELITPDKNFATLSMHFARRKAFELIEKEYDNVVFSRFDTHMNAFRIKAIVSEFPDAVVTPTNEQYGMVSDIFAIVPWKYADNYFFYPRAEDILSRRFNKKMKEWLSVKFYWENAQRDIRLHDENRYCPHMLCMRNFFETNTPYTVVDLPVFLRR